MMIEEKLLQKHLRNILVSQFFGVEYEKNKIPENFKFCEYFYTRYPHKV